jgi:hypothetical protein
LDFLGQADTTLVPLDFSPLHSRLLAQEVDAMLLLLDSVGVKMSQQEDIISDRLEAEGRILVEVVAEHVLMCFRSRDPKSSLNRSCKGPLRRFRRLPRPVPRTS